MRAFFLFLGFVYGGIATAAFSPIEVGTAQAIIDPPVGAFIAGHTLNRKFAGVHDHLYAKVVIVSNEETSWGILTLDCIGLLYPQLLQIREEVRKLQPTLSFPVDNLVLSSTHTHAGPDVVGLWGPERMRSGVDSLYMRLLIRTCAEQIIRAWDRRQPAVARYATTEFGEEWVMNISQPAEVDRSLTTLQFQDDRGRSLATFTNFACHPTFVDAVYDQVSADYVGGLYSRLDSLLGGVNLFLQGSIGGWVQPENEPKTFTAAQYRGQQLADQVLRQLRQSTTLSGSQLSFSKKVVQLPVVNPGFLLMSNAGVIQRGLAGGATTEIAWFTLGDATFATHPGETVPAMSRATRQLMSNSGPRFVLGLGMDALGYILNKEFFDPAQKVPHAEYLCSMSLGPETKEIIMQVLGELARHSSR